MQIDPKNIPNNISLTTLKILSILFDAGDQPTNVSDVADTAGIHNVSASEMLWKLEAKGHVKRTSHPTDRRQALFTLTQKGRSLAQSWQPEAALSTL